jgi:hypothetical protein
MPTLFNGTFPPFEEGFIEKEDARFYSIQIDENLVEANTEGGYNITRPRSTRKPRKTFSTGFSFLGSADYDLFIEFYEFYQQFRNFTWINPATLITYTVRFTKPPKLNYVGTGPLRLYNVEVILKEV